MFQSITTDRPNQDPQVAPQTFAAAAAALDYIAGRHSVALRDEDERLQRPMMSVFTDMHLHRESHYRQSHSDASALLATREVLAHAFMDLNTYPANERGEYLADLLTARCSDGTVSPFRFRVVNLLATYVSMMPSVDEWGLLQTGNPEVPPLFGWISGHGVFLDFIDLYLPYDSARLAADMATVNELGRERFETFEGIRYLPLEDLSDARYYRPDGSWEPLVERDLLPVRC